MKYFVRAVKYFFYYLIIFAIIMAVLVLFGVVDANAASMFRAGWKSFLEILLLFGVVASFYPKAGFISRPVKIDGEYSEIRNGIVDYMNMKGYSLETEEGENMTFRLTNKVNAVFRMLEDRITMTRELGGFQVEGLTKDVVRIIGGLEYKFRKEEE